MDSKEDHREASPPTRAVGNRSSIPLCRHSLRPAWKVGRSSAATVALRAEFVAGEASWEDDLKCRLLRCLAREVAISIGEIKVSEFSGGFCF